MLRRKRAKKAPNVNSWASSDDHCISSNHSSMTPSPVFQSSRIIPVGSRGKGHLRSIFWGFVLRERGEKEKLIYLTHTFSETLINLFRPEDRTENADWKWPALIYGSLSSLWCKKSLSTHRRKVRDRESFRLQGSATKSRKTHCSPPVPLKHKGFAEHTKSLLMKPSQLPNHHSKRSDPLFHSWHVQILCFQTLEIEGGSTSGYWYPVGRQSYRPSKHIPFLSWSVKIIFPIQAEHHRSKHDSFFSQA